MVNSQGSVFEARRACDSYMVDLDGRYCTCRLWDLSGIPCVHAIAAINYIRETPEGYINDYFSKEKFLACYETNILPVNGSNLWLETGYTKPLPPLARKMPGRPATKRRRHASEKESKFSSYKTKNACEKDGKFPSTRVRMARTVKCTNCLEYGHNKKGCKNETKPRAAPEPRKIGRPRKVPIGSTIGPKRTRRNKPVDPNEASGSNTQKKSIQYSNSGFC